MARVLCLLPLLGAAAGITTLPLASARPSPHLKPLPSSIYTPKENIRKRHGPLIGANYTHTSFRNCSWNGTAILETYQNPGVRAQANEQLTEMRAAGIETLRTIVWHMTDPGPNNWGPIPSANGQLTEPYRTNLADFASDVLRHGYLRWTVAMGPSWTNNPIYANYDPGKFGENWRFLAAVRSIVKRFGPPDTRIDILNEGASSGYLSRRLIRQIDRYVAELWKRYVGSYGSNDVVVSSIAPATRFDRGNRLQHLINALRATGAHLPRWFELPLNQPAPKVLDALRSVDEVLSQNDLHQPITIGETSYNDQSTAHAFSVFARTSKRKLDEVVEWFARAGSRCNFSPPYRADAYRNLSR